MVKNKTTKLRNKYLNKASNLASIIETSKWNLLKWILDEDSESEINNIINFKLSNIGRIFFDVKIVYNKIWWHSLQRYRNKFPIKENDLLIWEDEYTYFDWKLFHVYNKDNWEELGNWQPILQNE